MAEVQEAAQAIGATAAHQGRAQGDVRKHKQPKEALMGKSVKVGGHRVGVSVGRGKNGTTAVIGYHRKDRPRGGKGAS